MIKTDPVSGISFDAFTPWLQSLEFVDVKPYVITSNPKTHLYPQVSVTWGRKVNCAGGPAVAVGIRYEYILNRLPDGGIHAEFRMASGDAGWCGQTTDTVAVRDCPRHIKRMALEALRSEQKRRFDGCMYVQ